MNVAIILAHPWRGSFNWAIYENVLEALENKGEKCVTIDLNKDGFDPVMKESDVALFSKGQTNDPIIKKYQEILLTSDQLVFIFPIWWFGVPAILKGFFDKVLLKGFAYQSGKVGLKGLLTNVKKTTIITTSESPTWLIRLYMRSPIKNILIRGTLNIVGIRNVTWLNNGRTTSGTKAKKEAFLKKVRKHFSIET